MNDQPLNVQYGGQAVHYTTQFLASISEQEVILDCGSVVIGGRDSDAKSLPVHTRMALPWPAVDRLHRLLGEMLRTRGEQVPPTGTPQASLPPLSIDTSTSTST